MTNTEVIKPTDTERLIWRNLSPVKSGGLVRNSAFVFADVLEWPEWYIEPDKLNPERWESKLLAGCRGEWFAHVVEGRKDVLDVGCGFGFPSFYLARCGHQVTGIDPSPSEIATAKELSNRIKVQGSVEFKIIEQNSIPFADNFFDAATLGHSMECAGDPHALLSEIKRVLKPGSPVAIEEEDRSLDPHIHPVWEKCRLAFFDNQVLLWYETRITDPYLDRRYMIKMDPSGMLSQRIQDLKNQVVSKKQGLPVADFSEADITLDEALSQATEVQYSEAGGYDPLALKNLLVKTGFTDIRFFTKPDGKLFAEALEEQGLLSRMPDDIRGVLCALVKAVPMIERPVSTMVCCRVPGDSYE